MERVRRLLIDLFRQVLSEYGRKVASLIHIRGIVQ
jgi:hypothetical protein